MQYVVTFIIGFLIVNLEVTAQVIFNFGFSIPWTDSPGASLVKLLFLALGACLALIAFTVRHGRLVLGGFIDVMFTLAIVYFFEEAFITIGKEFENTVSLGLGGIIALLVVVIGIGVLIKPLFDGVTKLIWFVVSLCVLTIVFVTMANQGNVNEESYGFAASYFLAVFLLNIRHLRKVARLSND